jgi:hypothetical protein
MNGDLPRGNPVGLRRRGHELALRPAAVYPSRSLRNRR